MQKISDLLAPLLLFRDLHVKKMSTVSVYTSWRLQSNCSFSQSVSVLLLQFLVIVCMVSIVLTPLIYVMFQINQYLVHRSVQWSGKQMLEFLGNHEISGKQPAKIIIRFHTSYINYFQRLKFNAIHSGMKIQQNFTKITIVSPKLWLSIGSTFSGQ